MTNQLSARAKRVVTLLTIFILVAPFILGFILAGRVIEAQKASCQMVESGLGQINPNASSQPQTAEQCVETFEIMQPITYAIYVFGTYVFTVVVLGILAAFVVLLSFRKR